MSLLAEEELKEKPLPFETVVIDKYLKAFTAKTEAGMTEGEVSLPKATISSRFRIPTEKELHKHGAISANENTEKANQWAQNTWKGFVNSVEWMKTFNLLTPSEIFSEVPLEVQCVTLPIFFQSIAKKNGSLYPQGTYTNFVNSFDRINEGGHNLRIFDAPEFKETRKALDVEMRARKADGSDDQQHEKEGFTEGEIEMFWEKGIFGVDSLRQVIDTAFFTISMLTGSRGGESTRKVGWDNLTEDDEGLEYLQGKDLKTDSGGLRKVAGGGMRPKKKRERKNNFLPQHANPNRDPIRALKILQHENGTHPIGPHSEKRHSPVKAVNPRESLDAVKAPERKRKSRR
jgi:hypothetical protein